jgi:hypothetical protein
MTVGGRAFSIRDRSIVTAGQKRNAEYEKADGRKTIHIDLTEHGQVANGILVDGHHSVVSIAVCFSGERLSVDFVVQRATDKNGLTETSETAGYDKQKLGKTDRYVS